MDEFLHCTGKKQISIEGQGSVWPIWSQTTQELIFTTQETSGSGEVQIFTTKYRIDDGVFIPDRPVRWEGGTASRADIDTVYDLHPDRERLLVRSFADVNDTEQTFDHVVLFENFFDCVREQLSTSEN